MQVPELIVEREEQLLAPYAMHSIDSLGRQHRESAHPFRGPYQRDRDRILHSAAFRRLSHKTQVFTGEMGDYHRTRLTHTLEVASIARTIARALRLNEDLVEALAFAHDLGHPPFGHAGEDVLNDCLCEVGGFNHNAQCLRICELLETTYHDYSGLNLTREVLEGQRQRTEKRWNRSSNCGSATEARSPLLEVQVVDTADSIAYDAHDADDAFELGLLDSAQLLSVPLWQEALARLGSSVASLSERQRQKAIVHEVIDWQVNDVIENAKQQLAGRQIATVGDACECAWLIAPTPDLTEKKTILERFLFDNVYRHPDLLAERKLAQTALQELFDALSKQPKLLPPKFQDLGEQVGLLRAIGDYIAGMTDRFAFEEHRKLAGQPAIGRPSAGLIE